MEYKVIHQPHVKGFSIKVSDVIEAFEKQVKTAIDEGWKPQGSMVSAINAKNNNVSFYQAMIKG